MRIADLELESVWVGPPRDGGTELVLLHEGLGSITQWREVPAQLAERTGRPALVYARQGYGRSTPAPVPRPLTYMHDEAARLPAILDAERVTRPILVGHSDGASIAIIAAGSGVPVRGLVLIAPHVFVEAVSIASIEAARDRFAELRPKLARHHADVDGAFWGWNRAWLDPGFRRWNIEAFLPAIRCPVLVVQGSADEYGTLAQVDAIERAVPHAERLIVPGAGHTPVRDPAVVAEIAARVARMLA